MSHTPSSCMCRLSEADANALIAQQLAVAVTHDLITPAVQKATEQAFTGVQKGLDAVQEKK
jgi:hypothetical protein